MRQPCLLCVASFGNASTLLEHYGREHHPSLAFTVAVYGTTCPSCGQTYERLDQHASRTHRRSLAVLFWEQAREGDRHGVVAARVKTMLDLMLGDIEARLNTPT
jgi:hypothetical protein